MVAKIINDIDGWLVVDKPYDMGSTRVVSVLKRLMHPKKIGHAGTLDPLATGVLPIALGKATRLIPFVMDGEKEYEFEVTWGRKTATDDVEGDVIAESGQLPTMGDIESVLPMFRGEIEQVPPAYSAVHVDGKRAYDLARGGQEVALKARKVKIYKLEILELDFSVLVGESGLLCRSSAPRNDDCRIVSKTRFRVVCSKGTYVRSLGRDMGEKIGCLGHITALRRTKCGPFDLNQSILLANLEGKEYSSTAFGLISMTRVLGDIPVLPVNEIDARRLIQGQFLNCPAKELEGTKGPIQIKWNDQLIALAKRDGDVLKPTHVFVEKI